MSNLAANIRGRKRSVRTAEDRWKSLYQRAVARARKNDDPKLELLLQAEDRPRRILRELSILADRDVDREFGK